MTMVLKACPFCGEDAEFEKNVITVEDETAFEYWRVRHYCRRFAGGFNLMCTRWSRTITGAAEAWNRRAE